MSDTRKKNSNWIIKTNDDDSTPTESAHLAVMLDIRDELQQLNKLLHCENFVAIPHLLDAIRRNTARKRNRRSKV